MVQIISTALPDVKLLKPQVFGDERGFFYESYNERAFAANVDISVSFVQDNHSRSVQGVLRGLHYQVENAQGKLVRVTVGRVFDVAVDLRRASSHFGKWVGIFLDAKDKHSLWIPKGFGHGFLVLSEHAEFQYKTTDYYNPAAERTLSWDDPTLAIDWPLEGLTPQLSVKDKAGHLWHEGEYYS